MTLQIITITIVVIIAIILANTSNMWKSSFAAGTIQQKFIRNLSLKSVDVITIWDV